jgi:hopene-associated glycosyltransferase HpnB
VSALVLQGVGGVVVVIWGVLLFARDGWWRAGETDDAPLPDPAAWPSVVAVVPARDEAPVIGSAVASLAAQDYPGDFRMIVVDDGSSDGTADAARWVAAEVEIVTAQPLASGWTGKLAAVAQGIAAAGEPAYLWLTDADIDHAPDTLRTLVARAVGEDRVLVSHMARLRTDSVAERALVPAFVWFFMLLFPFRAVNRGGGVAAAAGGVMLVDRAALARAGGIAAIRGALIDDCALARLMQGQGRIGLYLTRRSVSLRPYPAVSDIGAMISRSAYAQLGYSPWLLAATVVGLALTFLAPPSLALFAHDWPRLAGVAAWGMMSAAFQPMLRFYRRSPAWGAAVPVIAAVYGWYTLVSAVQHWRGQGGRWKGRVQGATV